ncbi:MAG TPA: acetyltransferase [Candidatus Accumulibacter phosphatis]|nr:MAG: UDP-4-amino-4,6-dideoxy-N-acetyl-alpha-D-glucosamine N-acetyltransferase [Candidatus Accumulibacter sp. SK-11]HAY27296.1 transferase [Accumulibacter sp.]HRL76437.1 acetyltransferase [Candidatus Accumulibacter phosphatis]HCN67470.1 transferase [Accumulibacter sp.]HCV13929.1 transferase [Accumulibacter sp.]
MSEAQPRPLVIFGVGELAQLAHYYFTHDTGRRIAGFAADSARIAESEYQGLPLVPAQALETHFPPSDFDLFVAIGYSGLNSHRAERCAEAVARGYHLATYVSSRASVWPDLRIGHNCLLMEGSVIQPFVTIGNGVIVCCNSLISHHSRIDDHCFISSEATIAGRVRVGARSFIGVNATIRDNLSVGDDCIVGAGALLLQDTADGSACFQAGTPASGIPSRRARSLL